MHGSPELVEPERELLWRQPTDVLAEELPDIPQVDEVRAQHVDPARDCVRRVAGGHLARPRQLRHVACARHHQRHHRWPVGANAGLLSPRCAKVTPWPEKSCAQPSVATTPSWVGFAREMWHA